MTWICYGNRSQCIHRLIAAVHFSHQYVPLTNPSIHPSIHATILVVCPFCLWNHVNGHEQTLSMHTVKHLFSPTALYCIANPNEMFWLWKKSSIVRGKGRKRALHKGVSLINGWYHDIVICRCIGCVSFAIWANGIVFTEQYNNETWHWSKGDNVSSLSSPHIPQLWYETGREGQSCHPIFLSCCVPICCLFVASIARF